MNGSTIGSRCTRRTSVLLAALALLLASSCGDTTDPAQGVLAIVGGNGITADGGSTHRLEVVIIQSDQSPLVGATVKWTVLEGGGGLSESFSVTDAIGVARVDYTLGIIPVRNRIRAEITGQEVEFQLFATNDTPPVMVQQVGGLVLPEDLAFDNNGGLVVGSQFSGNVTRFDTRFRRSNVARGLGSVLGLAYDRAGFLYACDRSGGRLLRIIPGGIDETLVSGLNFPNHIAVHPGTGDLFVSETGADRVLRVSPSGAVATFLTGASGANGLAFDATAEHLYVATLTGGEVLRVQVLDGVTPGSVDVVGSVPAADGIALDLEGNVYVTGTAVGAGPVASSIYIIPADGSGQQVLITAALPTVYANLAFGQGGFGGQGLYAVSFIGEQGSTLFGTVDSVFLGIDGLPLVGPSLGAPIP